jgi:hypothetical protein
LKVKFSKEKFFAALVTAMILLVGSIFLANMGESLTSEASSYASGNEEEVVYDIDNVMSYYVEAISNENTLLYQHYNQDTSDEDITCLSCHDIETLRELYSQVEVDTENMSSSDYTALCLTCHGSYEELAELTAGYTDFEDSEGTIANPHEYAGGLADEHNQASCKKCHTSVHGDSDVILSSYDYCYGCHHELVFECNTCHDATAYY